MNRVVVTGGCGRFGRYVVRTLAAQYRIVIADRVAPPLSLGFPFQFADILDRTSLDRAFAGCDAIVHLAGKDLSTGAADLEYLSVNAIGTWNVCQAAVRVGASRLVFASSVAAWGFYDSPGSDPQYLPIDETHPLTPTKSYGLSKQLAETVTMSVARLGLGVVCLRFPAIAFPTEIAAMQRASRALNEPKLFCYVAPDDAARAISLALDRGPAGWSIFNVSAADSCLEGSTLDALQAVHGMLPKRVNRAYFDALPNASVLDGAKAAIELGFTPSVDWRRLSGAHQS